MSLSKHSSPQLVSLIKGSQPWLRLAIALDDPIRLCLLCVLHKDGAFLCETYIALPRDPKDLYNKLNEQHIIEVLAKLKRKKLIKNDQWNLLFPSNQNTDSSKFDCTLIVLLIKNFNKLPKTMNGKLDPLLLHSKDQTILAFVIRTVYVRNQVYHCGCVTSLDEATIRYLWTQVHFIATGLRYQGSLTEYETMSLDPDSLQLYAKFQARMQYQIDFLHNEQDDLLNRVNDELLTRTQLDSEVTRKITVLEGKLGSLEELVSLKENSENLKDQSPQLCEIIQSSEDLIASLQERIDNHEQKLQEMDKIMKEMLRTTPEQQRKVQENGDTIHVPKIRLNNLSVVEESDKDIVLTCHTDFKEYPSKGQHNVWSVITLKAPLDSDWENDMQKRAPIDLVAVIDKSGSMAGLKLALVKKTLRFVLTQLSSQDSLSVITYDSDVYINFELLKMTQRNKKLAASSIGRIQEGSRTNLCGGLLQGMCQLLDRTGTPNEVASVLLFTDGIANEGICFTPGIVQALKDPRRFCGPTFYPDRTYTPINTLRRDSEGRDDNISVYTFGFGVDHKPEMLKEISDAGNGMYYYISNEDKIAESFGSCLGGLLSTVAQGIQMHLTIPQGVRLKKIETGRPYNMSEDGKSAKINIGDLQSEEQRDIVLQLEINETENQCEMAKACLCEVTVDYYNVLTNKLESTSKVQCISRKKRALPRRMSAMNSHVDEQLTRIQVTECIKRASSHADEGDMNEARHIVQDELNVLTHKLSRSSMQGKLFASDTECSSDDEFKERKRTRSLFNDLQELSENFVDQVVWNTKGKKSQVNILQQHMMQRNSNTRSDSYETRARQASVTLAGQYLEAEID